MKTKKDIFKDIILSAETDCVLKIKLKDVKNPVITAVDKILKNKIVLKPTCLYGYKIRRRNITLLDIESVSRYHVKFSQPLFAKMRFIRNHIADIRYNFDTSRPV